jgi:pimeloyl-ACP methyl ester carboxylesterase
LRTPGIHITARENDPEQDVATFVLISGAWHASWCWERVVPLLEARGHRAIAPDLLGMGPEPTALGEVTFARWGD